MWFPLSLFFLYMYVLSVAAVAVVGLKIPSGAVEPPGASRCVWRTGTWCSDSDDDVCHWFMGSPARCSVCRLRLVRPAIHVYPNISGTYVHNLQRTAPTAFCRLSCVPSALRLPVLTRHRAHRDPGDWAGATVCLLRREGAVVKRVCFHRSVRNWCCVQMLPVKFQHASLICDT